MKSIYLILLLSLNCFSLAQTATAPTIGTGTSESPYQISTLNNLYWIAASDEVVSSPNRAARWAASYKQTASIDASSTSTWFTNTGWDPIGDGTTNFTGNYNGQGYSISGLTINRTTSGSQGFIGLFGVTSNATLSNIVLVNVSLAGNAGTGGLNIGALIGFGAGGTVTNCSSSGTLSTAFNYTAIGGLFGYLQGGAVSNCSSTASISTSNTGGGATLGGLVGTMQSASTLSQCYTNGTVTAPLTAGPYVGGVVGLEQGLVYNSQYCSITNSYSRSTVTGGYAPGGFAGRLEANASIVNCYSTGLVTGATGYAKGFVYSNEGTITNSFWDTEASGTASSSGATGKTTAEMKTNSTFLNASWSSSIWNIGDGINNGYPYLDWQNASGTPLPVELTLFNGNYSAGKVTLYWQTATEVTNYGFDVERCNMSNKVWRKIGFVNGHGNSNSFKEYSFTDSYPSSSNLKYRLKQIDFDGKYDYSKEVEVFVENPSIYVLEQNQPNPFNPETIIKYSIPTNEFVTIKIFDVLGREITILVNEQKPMGNHSVSYNAKGLASGIYLYKIIAGKYQETKKMLLIR